MDPKRERELEELLGDDPALEWSHAEHDDTGEFHPPESDFLEVELADPHTDPADSGIPISGDVD